MDLLETLLSDSLFLALLAGLAWITKPWWSEWVAQSIRLGVDRKLETFRADVRGQESEIALLRDAAISNFRETNTALVQRRIKAVDELWTAVNEWNRFTWTLTVVCLLKSDEVKQERGKNAALRSWIDAMLQPASTDIGGVGSSANAARPYLSEMTWALYSAYNLLFGWAAMEAKMLQMDGNFDRFWNSTGIDGVLIKALPDLEKYIRDNGSAAHMHLPEIFRTRILAELRRTLDGEKQDQEGISRAAAIIEKVRDSWAALEEASAKKMKPQV